MNQLLPRRVLVIIYGVAAGFLVLMVAAASVVLVKMQKQTIADRQAHVVQFANSAEAAMNRNLLSVDLMLASSAEVLQSYSAETVADEASRPNITQLLQGIARQNLLVANVVFLTPTGQVVAASDRRGIRPVNLPEGFVRQVLDASSSTLSISPPVANASTSQPGVYFARELLLADGSRLVAAAEVPLALLKNVLATGSEIEGLEVTLERDAGPLLTSIPPRDDLSGQVLSPSLSERGIGANPMRMASRLSGLPAIVVARPTLHRNLLIVASMPLQAALRDWRRERDFILGILAVFAAVTIGIAYLTHTHLRRQWRSKAMLDQALASMTEGFIVLDGRGRVLSWNAKFVALFPWSASIIAPLLPFRDIIARGDAAVRTAEFHEFVDDRTMNHADESLQWIEAGERELVFDDGRVVLSVKSPTPDGGLVCVYHDITDKRRDLAAITEGRAQLQATLEALPDVLLELGADGRCHRFHAPRSLPFVVDVPKPIGRRIDELLPSEAASTIMAAIAEARTAAVSAGRQFERQGEHGSSWFEVSAACKATHGRDADPRFIVILRDVTERKLAAREIETLAYYDGLTGLPNRPLLLNRLRASIESNGRGGRHGALLFIDLDKFKTLNDAHGHGTGNQLLQQVALRLRSRMRHGDTVARPSGDAFVVLLENLGADPSVAALETRAIGEAVLAEIRQPIELAGLSHHITCSIGATLFGGTGLSLDDLLKQSGIAMSCAKSDGGNAIRFFEADMAAEISARAALESELHAALAADEFVLYYQRQVDGRGTVVGAEVLMRWQHPERGLVQPSGFIDLAESTGLIVPIGYWAIEQACRQLAQWRDDPRRSHLTLAVNVSALQFRVSDFAERVADILARSGADATRLELELTESLLQDEVAGTIRKMSALAALGVRFSMDDFGTGYSSLSYMTQLPLHQIKIDKFFVHNIGVNPKVETIIQTIIAMARSLEIDAIAEGIETPEQLAFMQAHGCSRSQGYLFGRPVALHVFEQELEGETVG